MKDSLKGCIYSKYGYSVQVSGRVQKLYVDTNTWLKVDT